MYFFIVHTLKYQIFYLTRKIDFEDDLICVCMCMCVCVMIEKEVLRPVISSWLVFHNLVS